MWCQKRPLQTRANLVAVEVEVVQNRWLISQEVLEVMILMAKIKLRRQVAEGEQAVVVELVVAAVLAVVVAAVVVEVGAVGVDVVVEVVVRFLIKLTWDTQRQHTSQTALDY